MRPPALVPRATDYLRMIRDGWLALLVALALSVGFGVLAQREAPRTYQATGQLLVLTKPELPSYLSLAAEVVDRRADELAESTDPRDETVELAIVPGVSDLTLVVEADDRELATSITHDVRKELVAASGGVDSRATRGPLVSLGQVEVAEVDTPVLETYPVIAAGLGLSTGILLVVAVAALRGSVMSRRQVEHVVAAAALGPPR